MVLISLPLKISSRPRISVIKNGKDDLSVKSLDLIMKNPSNEKEKTTYSCRGFTITGDCSLKPNKQCVKSLGQCLSQILPPPARPTKNPNPRPNPRATTRPPKAPPLLQGHWSTTAPARKPESQPELRQRHRVEGRPGDRRQRRGLGGRQRLGGLAALARGNEQPRRVGPKERDAEDRVAGA